MLVALVAWLARNKAAQNRHIKADTIRDEARQESLHVKQREALADETAARSRAAQAEADIKAAQASGLKQQADARRGEAVSARAQVNEEWERADTMDPAVRRTIHHALIHQDRHDTTSSPSSERAPSVLAVGCLGDRPQLGHLSWRRGADCTSVAGLSGLPPATIRVVTREQWISAAIRGFFRYGVPARNAEE